MLQGLLEAIKKKKIVAILLVVGALLLVMSFLFLQGRDKKTEEPTPSDSTESSSEVGSSESSVEGLETGTGEPVVEVPAGPVTLVGGDISSLGLCVVLPADAGIVDPNVPKNKETRYQPVTTKRNGRHSEVSLHFADNTIAKSSIPVICLQGFDLGGSPIEEVLYQVEAELKNTKTYTYGEISDKILYHGDDKLILDVTFARTESPQSELEQRIAKFGGRPLIHPEGTGLTAKDLLADGSYIYKYDWMPTAAEYLRGHIGEMLVPIQYAQPHTLEELGYQFEMGSTTQNHPYIAAVSSSTVKVTDDGGHSGIYSAPVYGGERLLGNYTVLQPTYTPEEDTSGNPSSLALLQAFRLDELERPDGAIRFLRRTKPKSSSDDYYKIYTEGPFSEFSLAPEQLENYVVFRDNDIVVYNFFDFSKAPPTEDQLAYLAVAEGNEQYGALASDTAAAGTALLSSPGGVGRYIRRAG